MRTFALNRRAALKGLLAALSGPLGAKGAGAQDSPRDQGIGGTGAFGEIVKFGSVIVDGIEFAYSSDTPIVDDLGGAGADKLRIGQVVRATSEQVGTRIRADAISVEHEVVGPIEAIDAGAGILTILGQRVDLRPPEDVEQPNVGDFIAISGFRDGAGTILSDHFEPAPSGLVQVIGEARDLPDFARAALDGSKLKDRVIVRGRWDGTAATVETILPWSFFPQGRRPNRIALEGVFAAHVGERFRLGALRAKGSTLEVLTAVLEPSGDYRVQTVEVIARRPRAGAAAEKRRRDRDDDHSNDGGKRR